MSRPKSITLSPTALDRDGIATAQTLGGAASFTLDGALASGETVDLTQPQHVTIYSAGDNSGVDFTVTGTDRYGNAMTELITGPNATTVAGSKNFDTITSVASDGATTGDVEVGIDGTCESQWYLLNYRGPDFNVGLGCTISTGASLTYSVEFTFDDILAEGFVEDEATTFTHATISGETANADGNFTNPPTACRLTISSYTSGTATMTVIHAGRS